MNLAPVVLFVYNRPIHTKKTVDALKGGDLAKYTDLFVYADNSKKNDSIVNINKVKEVREYISKIDGFKSVTIIEARDNKGLANSVISGVSDVIKKYKNAIILEDDLITSKYFLNYMNNSLEIFKNREDIWSISGYTPPINIRGYNDDIFIVKRGCSWGWATWSDRWESIKWDKKFYFNAVQDKKLLKKFNSTGYDMSYMLNLQLNGAIDSWAIVWCYNQFIQNKYTVYPIVSFVQNIGMDNSGTHSSTTKKFQVDVNLCENIKINRLIKENYNISNKFRKFYSPIIKINISKFLRKIGAYSIIRKTIC